MTAEPQGTVALKVRWERSNIGQQEQVAALLLLAQSGRTGAVALVAGHRLEPTNIG